MNNQITILDRNNQNVIVDLLCYFSNNNKKYIFYSKNETVQDGLIKMYVSEENAGLNVDINQEEWANLKRVMQGIITGNKIGIEFLTYNNPKVFNEPKAIALNIGNVDTIKKVYKEAVATSTGDVVLNKDILSQNFGSVENTYSKPVQISPIPPVQNNFNMEATPVNLNINTPEVSTIQNSEFSVPTIEPINNDMSTPSIEPIPNIGLVQEPIINNGEELSLNINSIKPGGIDSGFKVSNEPNIFDNPPIPYQITEEEINTPITPLSNEFNNPIISQINNSVSENSNDIKNNHINEKKIELNNRKIKLFEELANVFREENDLLKGEEESSDLNNTASNLFNNNGSLNDSIIN